MTDQVTRGVELRAPMEPEHDAILTSKALDFIADLQRKFGPIHQQLASEQETRREAWQQGKHPDFAEPTAQIRESKWTIGPSPIPKPLQDRRVELVTSTERTMLDTALTSGAQVVIACMDNVKAHPWQACLAGHSNLRDALTGVIGRENTTQADEAIKNARATLVFQPRDWQVQEEHMHVDGQSVAAPIFDFGLFFFANQDQFIGEHKGCFLQLPPVQSYREALLWNEIFVFAQDSCALPRGKIKVTVPIATVQAAFEMHEILHALREHGVALSCGYHSYLSDLLKNFGKATKPPPAIHQNPQSAPCLKALAQLLIKTCHQRGAYAIGGLTNAENVAHLRTLKTQEVEYGFDGSQVARPDAVSTVREVFDQYMGEARDRYDERGNIVPKAHDVFAETVQGPNQLGITREDFEVRADDLLALS